MSGADPTLLIPGDYVVLRMALVDALDGDYEAAILFQRIAWRCERDGQWSATYADLQAETRLSEWKVKQAVKRLRSIGWLTSSRGNSYDPTQAWRIIWREVPDEAPAGGVESLPHVKEDSSRTVKEDSSRTSLQDMRTPPLPPRTDLALDEWFEKFWHPYPRKEGRKESRWEFERAVSKRGADPSVLVRAAKVYRRHCKDQEIETRYQVPPSRWLRDERWTDEYERPKRVVTALDQVNAGPPITATKGNE